MRSLRALVVGACAALAAPLWLRGSRFDRLLDAAAPGRTDAGIASDTADTTPDGSPAGSDGSEAMPAARRSTADDRRGSADVARDPERELARRAARALLRRLGRLPGSVWRNTCLYRAVAECLVLRRYDVPASVRIGVPPPVRRRMITAHAWVVPAVDGRASDADGHIVLTRPEPGTPSAANRTE